MQMNSPQGLMLHGEVGTGKSMLIDLFADCLPNRKKKRWHFNTFILETFSKLEALRQARSRGRPLPTDSDEYSLLWLAKEMIQTSPILFLDEFQMPDRVASKILTNLMTSFFQLGGVLVATSNRMPEELAKAAGISFQPPPRPEGVLGWQFGLRRKGGGLADMGGYNEFATFLEVLKARCEVWDMEGGKDYRRIGSGTVAPRKDENASEGLGWMVDGHEDLQHGQGMAGWHLEQQANIENSGSEPELPTLPKHYTLTSMSNIPLDQPWLPARLTVYGRTLSIPRAHSGTTCWTFPELCNATLGPADYISLASTYHTLYLTGVPVLTSIMKNEARRFITLLDALYECRCKLSIVSAAAGPDDIFFPDELRKSQDEGSEESVYSETLSEVYQDATAPFRPNILSENPNYAEPDTEPDYTHARLAGLLNAQQLEDDPPNKPASAASKGPFGRSFGRTDAELERKPVDPDEVRPSHRPDFSKTNAFTGEDERFAYKRAQSRLWEMCSERWWARSESDWHRPLPQSVRRWEQSLTPSSTVSEMTLDDGADVGMGASMPDNSRDERSFKRPEGTVHPEEAEVATSPFRTSREPPPKFSWTHFWGTMKWGPKAGSWGQGPEGLKERDRGRKG